MAILYHTLLTLHIVSFITFAGALLIDFYLYIQFWKTYPFDLLKANTIWAIKMKLSSFIKTGGAGTVLAGIGLMAISHGIFGKQTWMQIKLTTVLIALVNAFLLSHNQRKQIGNNIRNNVAFQPGKHLQLKNRYSFYYIVNLFLFLTIIVLSAFRFY